MKRIALILTLLSSFAVHAYDFSATVPTGQTIYFSIVGDGVHVVYPNTNADPWGSFQRPTGALTIPSTVSHAGTTYPVRGINAKAFMSLLITSLTLEEGIQSIATTAFQFCEDLAEIHLPTSLTTLASSAFLQCTGITDVYMASATPPASAAAGAFSQSSIATATLHVPCGSVAHYTQVAPWNLFGTIADGTCSVTLTTATSDPLRGTVSGGGVYSTGTSVVLAANPNPGYAFVCWNDGDTLNPRLVQALSDSHFVAIFQRPVHDTVLISSIELRVDTLYLFDTIVLHAIDTLYITDTLYARDTLLVHDTVTLQPTFFRLQVQSANPDEGIAIGNALLPAGTTAEIGALAFEGSRFVQWDDGNTDNPRQVVVSGDRVITAHFETLSLSQPWEPAPRVSVEGRTLTVHCKTGLALRLFDVEGRQLASLTTHQDMTRIVVPSAGVYIIQVGTLPARKVTIR